MPEKEFPMTLTAEEFVIVWQTSQNKGEVVSRADMTLTAVNPRAWRYRQMGIDLKDFRSSKAKLDRDNLRRLAKELEPANGKESADD
jgi:hypothetical protein